MSQVLTKDEFTQFQIYERDAKRYYKIRDRISTTTLAVITLSEPRPSEEYGNKIDELVDSIR